MNQKKNASVRRQSDRVDNCTCFHLRKATRAVTQMFDEALQPSGLYSTQFSLLAAISEMESTTITKLSQALIMDRTTLTRNLNPLQKQGYVKVVPGEDRRTRTLTLTRSGEKALQEAMVYWKQIQERVVKTLGKSHWQSLMDQLTFTVDTLNPY